MQRGAIILCGGQSIRMGHDKASLRFGAETMLQRVVRIVGETVALEHIVIVAGIDQPMDFPERIVVVRDVVEHRGPLAGLANGLHTLRVRASEVDAVFATGCDCPLIMPAFIERMFALLGEFDAAVPVDGKRRYPLAAVYRPCVLPAINEMLAGGRLKAQELFSVIAARQVPVADLRSADPELRSLRNVNTPAELGDALHIAGLSKRGPAAPLADRKMDPR